MLELVVRKKQGEPQAKVFSGNREIATIKKGEGMSFRLINNEQGREWILTNMVHGERRPFSFSVLDAKNNIHTAGLDSNEKTQDEIFVVRDQLFNHNGRFYMLASHPSGKSWKEYVNSSIRYISRLDDFPYVNLSQVDHENYKLRHKIKRLRGTAVGEASGLAIEESGHRVLVDKELNDIGLFIAAISYLLYAAG